MSRSPEISISRFLAAKVVLIFTCSLRRSCGAGSVVVPSLGPGLPSLLASTAWLYRLRVATPRCRRAPRAAWSRPRRCIWLVGGMSTWSASAKSDRTSAITPWTPTTAQPVQSLVNTGHPVHVSRFRHQLDHGDRDRLPSRRALCRSIATAHARDPIPARTQNARRIGRA